MAKKWMGERAFRLGGSVVLTSIAYLGSGPVFPGYSFAQEAKVEPTQLEPIVVTASGFEQSVKDAPASITVLTREELEKGSYRDLTDALRHVQGVAVTGGTNGKDIYIRGMPGSYTLILVDGKRQSTRDSRTNGTDGFEQSFVPPLSAIERIEVVRGPMSSLYGSDAVGGVINIITRKNSDAWHGSVTTDSTLQQHDRFGNSGQANWYLNGPVLKDVLGVQLWGSGVRRAEDQIVDGATGAKDYDLTARLAITPNEDHDIYLEGGRQRLWRDQTTGNTLKDGDDPIYRTYTRDFWSLQHTGRWGPTTSDFSIQQEWAQRNQYFYDRSDRGYDLDARRPEIRNTVIDGKFTTPFDLFGQHTLVTGGQFLDARLSDQNPGRRTGLNETFDTQQWALFAEDQWQITDDFALTTGTRYNYHDLYGSNLSPRIYAVWNATPDLTIKGGVSTGFRAPEIRYIAPGYAYTTGGPHCTYGPRGSCGVIIADPDLKAETSTSYEFGAVWDTGDVELSGTYFYTDFKNKINSAQVLGANGLPARWSEDPNYRLWYNYNVDAAILQGVELAATWQATDDLSLRANYTYTKSEQQTGMYEGFPLARTPENMANIRADWTTSIDGVTAWAAADYHGSEIAAGPRIGNNGKPVTIKGQLGREYSAYATLDLGAQYKVNNNFTLSAAVYNLFDKRVEPTDFNTTMEGRRLWVSMKSEF